MNTREELIEVMARAHCAAALLDADEQIAFHGRGFQTRWQVMASLYSRRILAAIEAAGCVVVPRVPDDWMGVAARDWSAIKYGRPIGTDASNGCWAAMIAASPFASETKP